MGGKKCSKILQLKIVGIIISLENLLIMFKNANVINFLSYD